MSPSAPVGRSAASATIRAGFELTGLELDAAGSARATRRLREALEGQPGLEMIDLAQPVARGPLSGRVARGLARELTWFPLRLPRRARALGLDLLHCPVPLAPVRPSIPLVLTLHDTLAWEHPEWFARALVIQHRLVVARAARRAARVLAPSRYSAQRACTLLDLDPGRVDVVPWAADPVFTPGPADEEALERLGVRRPYVLTVGTLQPRKNLETALHAFEGLAAAGAEHQLVVVGARGWRDQALAERLRRSPAGGRVVVAGRLGDADLVSLYRGAQCLLFCSRGEGFGLPTLEAMACGTPVVCSSTTAVAEVAGDAAALAHPDDVADVERALLGVLGSAQRRDDLSRRGLERAAAFSWERCARQTAAAYRRALGG